MDPGKLILFILGSVAVIFGAYYTTWYIGKKSNKVKSGRNIVLRDSFFIAKDKSFYLVELSGKLYFIAMTNGAVTLLDTLSPDAIPKEEPAASFIPNGMVAKGISELLGFIKNKTTGSGADIIGKQARGKNIENFDSILRKTDSANADADTSDAPPEE
jgi:flagellar biogenesis protein FliO